MLLRCLVHSLPGCDSDHLQVVSEKREVMTELSDLLSYRILYLPIFIFFEMPCFKKSLTLLQLVFLVLENIHYAYGYQSFLFINKAFSFLDKLKLDAFILTPVKFFITFQGLDLLFLVFSACFPIVAFSSLFYLNHRPQ